MTRRRFAQALAFVALLAAFVGAYGPAQHVSTTYSWPPQTLPTGTPSRAWYTPLLLVRRQPEALTARVPCTLPAALPDAARPETVLATARFPRQNQGLSLVRRADRLVVSVGEERVARVAFTGRQSTDPDCGYRLFVAERRWSLEGGPGRVLLAGDLETMPTVSGVFSSLDLRSAPVPSIDIQTGVHAARTTTRQAVAWIVAVLCGLGSLLLVAVERRPRGVWSAVGSRLRAGAAHAGGADAVVAVSLAGWWVISPAFYDDGWVVARQSMFSSSRGFSNYYDSLGANHPLGYWLEWSQHWLTQETTAMFLLRAPAVLCLAATWVLCRWLFSRVLAASSANDDRVALWALTATFVSFSWAWGMTLRPEPVVALLVTGVVVCAARFLERPSAAPLAIAAVLVVLALSAHPSAIVSIAPLIVVLPSLVSWARGRLTVVASIVTATFALLLVLGTVGSDIERRRADAGTIRAYGNANAGVTDELSRYADLFTDGPSGWGTPLRRASVALMAIVVLAFLLRVRRRQPLLNLPAMTLWVGLLLLIPTPSKFPWHFGMLAGVASVAVAAETARLREDARRSRGWSARPFVLLGAGVIAAAWSWSQRYRWSDLDLARLDWRLGFERDGPTISTVATVLPVLLLVGLVLSALLRRQGQNLHRIPWHASSWITPVLAIPLLAFTAAVLVVDAGQARSWTLTSQNVETIRGELRCGLADDALVTAPASIRALGYATRSAPLAEAARGTWPPPVDGIGQFDLGPSTSGSPSRSPWFEQPDDGRIGFFLSGRTNLPNIVALEWGRERRGAIELIGTADVRAASERELRTDIVRWRLFPASELPVPEQKADAVRLAFRTRATGETMATTAPVTYANEPLVRRIDRPGVRTLVPPNLLLYAPCAEQPRLADGVVEVPDLILAQRDSLGPILGIGTGPFEGLLDLYALTRLPLTDSDDPPGNVVLYDVDRRIPGALEVPPVATIQTS